MLPMPTLHAKVEALQHDLRRVLLERDQPITNALLALLTRQHHIQYGPPGSAKSMLIDALHLRITGTRRFRQYLNPGTTAEDLLGPRDLLKQVDEGKYLRRHAR